MTRIRRVTNKNINVTIIVDMISIIRFLSLLIYADCNSGCSAAYKIVATKPIEVAIWIVNEYIPVSAKLRYREQIITLA